MNWTFILSLAAFSFSLPIQAGRLDRVRECISRAIKKSIIDPNVANLESFTVYRQDIKDPAANAHFQFERKIANGFIGTVYDASLTDRSWVNHFKGEVVAKVGNRSHFSTHVMGITEEKIVAEVAQTELIANAFPGEILPVCPILGKIKSDQGTVIFKPKMIGQSVKDLGRAHVELNAEMKSSLAEIYKLAQRVYAKVKVAPKTVFSLDIKPDNLLWITDEALLKSLGFSKEPRFILIEVSHTTAGNYRGPGYSLDDYYHAFESYVAAQKN